MELPGNPAMPLDGAGYSIGLPMRRGKGHDNWAGGERLAVKGNTTQVLEERAPPDRRQDGLVARFSPEIHPEGISGAQSDNGN